MTRPRLPSRDAPPGDPERVYQAQRYGIFRRRLDAERVDDLGAEDWISRWEREAEVTGRVRLSQGLWDEGWRWIPENRRRH